MVEVRRDGECCVVGMTQQMALESRTLNVSVPCLCMCTYLYLVCFALQPKIIITLY